LKIHFENTLRTLTPYLCSFGPPCNVVCECDESGVEMQVGLELPVPVDEKVERDQLVSLDSKAYQAGTETLERREILEHRVRMANQDHRVQLVSLETRDPLLILDGLVHWDVKDKLDFLAHKVVECCILT